MHIAILTFDGFNELDSLIAYGMLSRISLLGDSNWQVSIASPTKKVTSMNGLVIDAHLSLDQLSHVDAVLIGSGMKTRAIANDPEILNQLVFDPKSQLIAAQCSGTYLMIKLGLVNQRPVCTDTTSRVWMEAEGVNVLNQAFLAEGNLAFAGGCLSAQYLATWFIARLKSVDAAKEAMNYFAPVGEKDECVARAMNYLRPNLLECGIVINE